MTASDAILPDGRLVTAAELPDEPYVYQTLHTLGYKALHTGEHLRLASLYGEELFGCSVRLIPVRLQRLVSKLLDSLRYPKSVSCFVELRLYASGLTCLRAGERGLAAGYLFRPVYPNAVTIPFYARRIPCSATREAIRTADWTARAQKADAWVGIGPDGRVACCDGCLLFGVEDRTVLTPRIEDSVDYTSALHAIRSAGYRLRVGELTPDDLGRLDELFYIDHRGITALRQLDGRLLMHIIAERIALKLNDVMTK